MFDSNAAIVAPPVAILRNPQFSIYCLFYEFLGIFQGEKFEFEDFKRRTKPKNNFAAEINVF